jgi:hypothetical protein
MGSNKRHQHLMSTGEQRTIVCRQPLRHGAQKIQHHLNACYNQGRRMIARCSSQMIMQHQQKHAPPPSAYWQLPQHICTGSCLNMHSMHSAWQQ